MIERIFFYFISFVMISSTVYILFSKRIFNSLIAMFIIFLSTAAIYFMLGINFLGIFQLIIYTGAIMVLFITAMNTLVDFKNIARKNILSIFFSILVVLSFIILSGSLFKNILKDFPPFSNEKIAFEVIAKELFNNYPLQIEVISLILFVAVIISYSLLRGDRDEL